MSATRRSCSRCPPTTRSSPTPGPRLTDLAERPLVHYDSANGLAGRVDRICAAAGFTPRGTAIDDPTALDLLPLKPKSISWHWEFMFTRPLFSPEDTAQHRLLNEVAELIESGAIRTTITARLQPLNAATVREAHRLVETGSTIGKVVVSAR